MSISPHGTCWYADESHRPTIGRCPDACNGEPTHGERRANGEQLVYCEAHAFWRRQDVGGWRLYPLTVVA